MIAPNKHLIMLMAQKDKYLGQMDKKCLTANFFPLSALVCLLAEPCYVYDCMLRRVASRNITHLLSPYERENLRDISKCITITRT